VAEVSNGVKPWSADQLRKRYGLHPSDVFPETEGGKDVYPFLAPSSISLGCVAWDDQSELRCVNLTKPLERPRERWFPRIVRQKVPKVILKAETPPDGRWRLQVALDDGSFVPRNSLHFVLPRDEERKSMACAIAAVLTSRLVNAWVYCHNRTAQVHTSSIEAIPVPKFSPQLLRILSSLQRRVAKASARRPPDEAELLSVLNKVDDECERAYGCGRAERELLDRFYAHTERPGPRGVRLTAASPDAVPAPSGPEDLWITYGEVVEVNCDSNDIVLWLADTSRSSHEIRCSIPPAFPGWALEPGAAFEAEIERAWLKRRTGPPVFLRITPVGYGYVSDEDWDTYRGRPSEAHEPA
jgi:hypothetical protein